MLKSIGREEPGASDGFVGSSRQSKGWEEGGQVQADERSEEGTEGKETGKHTGQWEGWGGGGGPTGCPMGDDQRTVL